jgi:ABC-type transport system involved in multi-copper enzyme maturation permease subunit
MFRVLASEAIGDAMRRRIVPMIVVVALLSLMSVDSCTSCAANSVAQGNGMEEVNLSGWTGMIVFTLLSLWTMVLAGMLASDHLAEPLFDGSAFLVLARPVHRHQFVAARLAGALVIALTMGIVVLAGTAALLHFRNDLPIMPAVWAGLACAAGSLVVSAMAMTLSLLLTRIATALSVLVFVASIAFINSFTLFGASLSGLGRVLQEFTPPLCTAIVVALAPWTHPLVPNVDPNIMILKLVTWMIVSCMLLFSVFRRQELGSS